MPSIWLILSLMADWEIFAMSNENKTHYRKAFHSPYLSSADIVEPTILTIRNVVLEQDKTKKTKDVFNTAYFVEPELRPGEPLKPMILNAGNSKTIKGLTGSPFIEDWSGIRVTVYIDPNVRFGKETVEGLRISYIAPQEEKPILTPAQAGAWKNAKASFIKKGNLHDVLKRVQMSPDDQRQLIEECEAEKSIGTDQDDPQ